MNSSIYGGDRIVHHSREPFSQYRETQIKTSKQGQLIVLLYEGAMKFLKLALAELPQKKYDRVNQNILKAQDIITELILALDLDSGELAKKLYGLYSYMNRRLVEGNIRKEAKPLEEVMVYLEGLNKSWKKIAHLSTQKDGIELDQSGGLNIKS